MSALDEELHFYAHRGLAESTHRTYRAGVNKYISFCFAFHVNDPFPVSEATLCYFVVSMALQGLAPATVKTYLAAVRHAQVIRGFPDLRDGSSLPRLQLVQSGIRRERARQGPPPRTRLPITPPILRRIKSTLMAARPQARDDTMLWAAATVCFFGFFRAGEITVPSASAYDSTIHLAWGDVTADAGTPPQKVRVFLKRSKTDQFGRGVEVWLGATGDDLCPVAAVLAYVVSRGSTPGPFFRCEDGSPLTKPRFVERVRVAMAAAGIEERGYSGHSFRIGAATAAAEAGLEDSVIQALGRWSSSAFLRYIRTPREHLARHSGTLTGSSAARTRVVA